MPFVGLSTVAHDSVDAKRETMKQLSNLPPIGIQEMQQIFTEHFGARRCNVLLRGDGVLSKEDTETLKKCIGKQKTYKIVLYTRKIAEGAGKVANIALLAGPKTLSHDNNAMISTKHTGNHDSVGSSEKESKNCFVEFDECAHIKATEDKGNSDEDKPAMSLSERNIVAEISPLMWKTLTHIFLYKSSLQWRKENLT